MAKGNLAKTIAVFRNADVPTDVTPEKYNESLLKAEISILSWNFVPRELSCFPLGSGIFQQNKIIKSTIDIRYLSNLTALPAGCFNYCSGLLYIILPENITSVMYNSIRDCSSLIYIKFLSPTMVTTTSNALQRTNNCPVYVPSDLVETYKTSSSWSQYASRFYSL